MQAKRLKEMKEVRRFLREGKEKKRPRPCFLLFKQSLLGLPDYMALRRRQ
jgi:hypothetical protein